MPDYLVFYDSQALGAHHLNGKSCVVTIEKVVGGTLVGKQNKRSKKPLVYFKGKDLPLALSKTDGKTISRLFGTKNTDEWIGKSIEIYPTVTEAFGEKDVPCVRVRPTLPEKAA